MKNQKCKKENMDSHSFKYPKGKDFVPKGIGFVPKSSNFVPDSEMIKGAIISIDNALNIFGTNFTSKFTFIFWEKKECRI